ncbi:hypothetical protein DPMN_131425 [Dreissena polymorpha]|uniref:Uncharacterized protein n=1 Tax=Dreissena polymorpha TaxID=45954 RepID=A0A9D4K018_DREPO|nr:hypothetical protein DPMN_131377 [Dreissena polymorpha]KAH3829397.1 hypothetical protein DPMN_131393 [Dreissena polymorpha]KAH3829413.1 hypothetical protein DPMN_131409 [Dreissena polymorpha]KAH3829429.1 hypothetical protein DPMN_131425 [Dreissena polymorpha]
MVRKARDTGGPLVPYETASGGRLPRPRPRETVRKARDTGSRYPVRDRKRRPPSETPAARDGPQGQGHGVPLASPASLGIKRQSAEKQALRDRSPRPNVFVLSGTIGSKNTKTAIASPPGEMLGRNQAADSGHCPVYRLDPSSALFDPRDGPGVRLKVTNPNDNPNGTGYVQKNTTSISGTVGRVEKERSRSPTPGARGSTSKRIPLRSAGPSDESKKSVRAPPPPGARGSTEHHLDQRDRRASRKRAFALPHPRGPGGLLTLTITLTRRAKSKRIPLRSAGPSAESKKSVRAPPPPGPGGCLTLTITLTGRAMSKRTPPPSAGPSGESRKSVRAPPPPGPGGFLTLTITLTGRAKSTGRPPRSAGPSGESKKSVRPSPPPGPGGLLTLTITLTGRAKSTGRPPRSAGPSGESKKSVRPSPTPGPGGLLTLTKTLTARAKSERTPPRSAGPSGESN